MMWKIMWFVTLQPKNKNQYLNYFFGLVTLQFVIPM